MCFASNTVMAEVRLWRMASALMSQSVRSFESSTSLVLSRGHMEDGRKRQHKLVIVALH